MRKAIAVKWAIKRLKNCICQNVNKLPPGKSYLLALAIVAIARREKIFFASERKRER